MFHIGVATQHPPLPEPDQLSESGIDFIEQCLALDATERPSASELRQHSWIQMLAEHNVSARLVSPLTLVGRRRGVLGVSGGSRRSRCRRGRSCIIELYRMEYAMMIYANTGRGMDTLSSRFLGLWGIPLSWLISLCSVYLSSTAVKLPPLMRGNSSPSTDCFHHPANLPSDVVAT